MATFPYRKFVQFYTHINHNLIYLFLTVSMTPHNEEYTVCKYGSIKIQSLCSTIFVASKKPDKDFLKCMAQKMEKKGTYLSKIIQEMPQRVREASAAE
jgi:hypothetical protein